jgi:TetR/AcrR family transcriptional regulator
MPFEPLDAEVLRARRATTVKFLGQALFQDRKHGAELAAKVLADMPMPETSEFKQKSII